jgi:cell division protease FtsH
MMGVERKSLAMSEEDKRLTAYHEGGHALVTIYSHASDPIHKATIIPRGRALGMVMRLPENDRFSATIEKYKADLAVAMGGRVAEEIVFGHNKITSGASSDIKHATSLARAMVTQWGMSKEIGPILVGEERGEVFLGHSIGNDNKLSDKLRSIIDSEVKKLVEEGYSTAKKILTDKIDELHLIAKNLIEYETLSGQEIKDLIAGKLIKRKDTDPLEGGGSAVSVSSIPLSNSKKSKPKTPKKPAEA